jgi:hypothetical protein
MTEHEWNVVFLNNSLLHGLIFDPESKTFKPAREPGKWSDLEFQQSADCLLLIMTAFKLAKRYGDRYVSPAGYSNSIQIVGREVVGIFSRHMYG